MVCLPFTHSAPLVFFGDIHDVHASVLVVKIMLGVHLLTYATRRRAEMEAREEEDKVNDFGRDPIGEGKEEQVRGFTAHPTQPLLITSIQRYNKELKTLLDNRRDDANPVAEIGELAGGKGDRGDKDGGKRKRLPLEDITRFTMVKRIW